MQRPAHLRRSGSRYVCSPERCRPGLPRRARLRWPIRSAASTVCDRSGPAAISGGATGTLHRYRASVLGLMIVAILLIAWHKQPPTLPFILVAVVVFQGMLGMGTVTPLLRPAMVTAHLLGGMTILALLAGLAMGQFVMSGLPEAQSRFQDWAEWRNAIALGILLLQIALWTRRMGALVVTTLVLGALGFKMLPLPAGRKDRVSPAGIVVDPYRQARRRFFCSPRFLGGPAQPLRCSDWAALVATNYLLHH